MKLDSIAFEIAVILGTTNITIKDYLGLLEGDVIVLDQTFEQALTARVGSTEHFFATIGLFRKHKAIIIDGRIHNR